MNTNIAIAILIHPKNFSPFATEIDPSINATIAPKNPKGKQVKKETIEITNAAIAKLLAKFPICFELDYVK